MEQKNRYQEGMYFKEQHEYFLDLFSLENDAFGVGAGQGNVFSEGTIKDFKIKAFGFIFMLFALRFLLDIQLPPWFMLITLAAVCFLMIEGVTRVVNDFNEIVKKKAFIGVFGFVFLFIGLIWVIGYVG